MYCKNCGFNHEDDATFCRRCGNPIESPVVTVVRVPVKTVDKQSNKKSAGNEIITSLLKIVFIILTAFSIIVFISSFFVGSSGDEDQITKISMSFFILFFMVVPNILILLMFFRKSVSFLQRFTKRHFFTSAIASVALGFLFMMIPTIALAPTISEIPIYVNNNSSPTVIETQATQTGEITQTVQAVQTLETVQTIETVQTEQTTMGTDIATQEMAVNLKLACEQIGIDISEISNLTQKDDWVGGPRYTFDYRNTTFILYFNYDYSVETINLGFTKIYHKGYKPLDVNEFLVESDQILLLQTYAVGCVEPYLSNPDTAEFSMFDWGFAHYGDIYVVSGIVTAKNDLGQAGEISFYLEVELIDEAYNAVYLEMNNSVLIGTESVVEIPEPAPLPTEVQPTSTGEGGTITLVDGELGAYGEINTIDGEEYIWFKVPAGKYLVTSKVPFCTVFVNKDEVKTNSDGYGETEVVIMLPIRSGDEPQEITVGEDEHIYLTISATIEITPVN